MAKIKTTETDVVLGLPEDDDTPAGVKLSHGRSIYTRGPISNFRATRRFSPACPKNRRPGASPSRSISTMVTRRPWRF